MSINSIKVLLCTGAPSEIGDTENQYKKCLSENGFICEVLQVLHFIFINQDELYNHLIDSESYSGLIITSPRAVEAISMIKTQDPFCIKPWLKQPIFCIGKTTEYIIKEQIGFTNILGSDSGNAKNLADFIIKIFKKDCKKPLLLPCSNIARDTIPQMLLKEGMKVKKIIVYETKAQDLLEKTLYEALLQLPHVLVFFSPSIVENITALYNEKSVFEKYKIIAIGPVTEQTLLNIGIKVDGVSEKPEPKALVKVIKKLFNN